MTKFIIPNKNIIFFQNWKVKWSISLDFSNTLHILQDNNPGSSTAEHNRKTQGASDDNKEVVVLFFLWTVHLVNEKE